MAYRYYFFLLLSICGLSNASGQMVMGEDTLVGNEWIRYGQQYFKFSVDTDGVYRIPFSTLDAAGLSAEAIGTNFRLYSMGQQVPIFVSTDAVFGANDFIEFYGFRNRGEMDRHLFRHPDEDMLHPDHSMYTDQRVYYLTTSGDEPPLRVNTLVNNVSNPPAAETYYIHKEVLQYNAAINDPYYPVSGGGAVSYSSYMHSEGFCKASETNSSTQITTSNLALTGPDGMLHIRLTSTNYGSHEFVVTWNDLLLDTILVKDLHIIDVAYHVPLAQIQENNLLTVSTLNTLSRHSLVSIEFAYPRSTNVSGMSASLLYLDAAPNEHYFVLDEFPHLGVQPIVYTADGKTRLVADINVSNQVHFLWPALQQENVLYLVDPVTSIKIILTLEQKVFTDFSSDNTEYIVITHPDLMEIGTESEYIQYRRSAEGGYYRAKAYSILDLYDQFGYGIIKHPQAIRNFVEFFHRNWPSAKMIFILGRGIEYTRSRYTPGTWESSFFVPTFGRPGSDNLLAATLWDLVPRYPVGRLAAIENDAIRVYLDKVKEHDTAIYSEQTLEEKSWMKNVIHISGGQNSSEQSDFQQTLNALGTDITESDFGAKVSFFQKESTDIIGESISKQIQKLLNEGSCIINYLGHSSTSTFEFTINDPAEWNNKGRYPIFSAMGCSAGQIHGTLFSLSDRYVQIRDEGTIAFISGSGSQFASALIAWARPWYDYFGNLAYGSTLGESILFGLKGVGNFVDPELAGSNSYRYLLEQQTFQGDPALKLYPLPGPDYLIDPNSVSIGPEILNTKLDSFDLNFSIENIGRNLRQDVHYSVRLRTADGEEMELIKELAQCGSFSTFISKRLPLAHGLKAGSYRLLIDIDPNSEIEELPTPQAETNNSLKDNLGVEGIQIVLLDDLISAVYPPDFAIVRSAPELIASGSNAFINGQAYIMEIDTTPLFNSPALVREMFQNHSATLKWSPEINYADNQEYYWRVSLDSVSPEQDYLWSKRSFLFKSGSAPGWNQSHFYQQTDNLLDKMLRDSLHLHFDFESAVTNFRILNRYQKPNSGEIPFGFIDNVYYTEFFSKFTNNAVHVFVVAINPVTGAFMHNPNPGLYGSFNNLSYDAPCFPYRTDLPESRQALVDFIQNIIPPEYYVFLYTYQRLAHPDYFPEQWASDEDSFEHSIFSLIESEYPSSAIRTLAATGSKPYIVFFQKGIGGVEEIIAADTSDVIAISYDIKGSLGKGAMVSSLIGPASKWYSIHWDHSLPETDTAGATIISAWALTSDLADTLWISNQLINHDTLIDEIDATLYPYIQLRFSSADSINYKPQDLFYWRVLYEGFPELVIQHDLGFEFIADTLNQGETMSLSTYVENVSPYDVDTLPVSLRIIGSNNTAEELTTVIHDIKGHSDALIEFEKNTSSYQRDYQVILEVNPGREINEVNYTNNIGILPMYIRVDNANPVLDVTFDGYHIKDGDLVAARPFILIRLHDENENLRLADTSAFRLFLEFPSAIEPRPMYFSNPWVRFIPSSVTGQNIAYVELTPELLENGIYTLQVNAKDATGNSAGDNDYIVSFEVKNEQAVSYIYNYPNPFSSSTRFIYTLTGPGSPPNYKIEILSITGILVREITQDELGPLAVGAHMTEYIWDGTDQYGSELSAGIYLYRLIVKDENGNDFERYDPYGDSAYSNKGWGKLVIVR